MKKKYGRHKKEPTVIGIINKHIENNFGLYFFLGIIFLISIAIGVLFVNSLSNPQIEELKLSINKSIENITHNQNNYLKEILKENALIFVIMWFSGLTIIGIIVNYVIIIYKGFCLGYTISAIAISIGKGKAVLFVLSSMLFQNILFIPALFAVVVSSMKLLKSIIRERNRESIMLEIIRHTIISAIMCFVAICSGCVEVFLSNGLLKLIVEQIK